MTATMPPTTLSSDNPAVRPGRAAPARPLRHTLRNALIITRREVRDSFRDWRIIAPIIILTFFFPFLAQAVAAEFSDFLRSYGAELIGERTIPFLLMIVGFFPISISLVIALETFVGEKERRSLEPLLSTPLTNTELYIGKTLAAMIPPLIASFGGMVVYLTTLLAGELAWRPPAMLIVQIFLLTIVQALVMVTGAVVVSSQTTSTRAANLLASFIIIPMTLLINGESIIMFLAPDAESPAGIGALWAIIVGMLVVVLLLLRIGNSLFNREELLGRTIDQMNIGSILRNIARHFRAAGDKPARGLVDWYTRAIPYSLRRLKTPAAITLGVFLVAFAAGFGVGLLPEWRLPLPASGLATPATDLLEGVLTPAFQEQAVLAIVWQNGRILLAATLLAFFSFGVLALILTPLVYVVLGYILAQMLLSGQDLLLFLIALVPHGVVEIPVIVLATAAAFRLGSVITRPPAGSTPGAAWTMALGDTLKLWVGLVVPGLILAAVLETYVTFPLVAGYLLR
ncbi:MAG: stage II sporulation protein M [Anaerolineae bacterium]|jgi:uncharacterized membrane protein SpoIIM required for sporulation/ABC-type transport system involved in multi-copper enzyme maturation permease subunit|nr:stage II sporulation protein M [Anaerolineae bacterium]